MTLNESCLGTQRLSHAGLARASPIKIMREEQRKHTRARCDWV